MRNALVGAIPQEICDCKELKLPTLGPNHKICGEVPEALGSSLMKLKRLYLHGMDLSSTVPKYFEKLEALQEFHMRGSRMLLNAPEGHLTRNSKCKMGTGACLRTWPQSDLDSTRSLAPQRKSSNECSSFMLLHIFKQLIS